MSNRTTRFSKMTVIQSIRNAIAAGLLVAGLAIMAAGNSIAQTAAPDFLGKNKARAQYGDWKIVCKHPPGSKREICALVQDVTAEDRPTVGLTVQFQRFADGTSVLRVYTSTGILLQPGLHLKIDGRDVVTTPFLRCLYFACLAQLPVDDKILQLMRNGKTALFVIFQTKEVGIGIPVSLRGFAEGLVGLK
jgi:invasion protein IalB